MNSRETVLFLFCPGAAFESALAIFPSVFMAQNLLYIPERSFSVRVFVYILYVGNFQTADPYPLPIYIL